MDSAGSRPSGGFICADTCVPDRIPCRLTEPVEGYMKRLKNITFRIIPQPAADVNLWVPGVGPLKQNRSSLQGGRR